MSRPYVATHYACAAVLHMSVAVLSHDRVRTESVRFKLWQGGVAVYGPIYAPSASHDLLSAAFPEF